MPCLGHTVKNIQFFKLKFKFNWESCILPGNATLHALQNKLDKHDDVMDHFVKMHTHTQTPETGLIGKKTHIKM